MNPSVVFIIVAVVVLAVVAVLTLFVNRGRPANRLTPLAGIAFGCVLAGILFGVDRVIGYSLLAVGVILAVIDLVRRSRRS